MEIKPVEKPISANAASNRGIGRCRTPPSSANANETHSGADQDRQLVASEQTIARSPERTTQHAGQRRDEQDVAAALEIKAVDMGQVGPAPKTDDQHDSSDRSRAASVKIRPIDGVRITCQMPAMLSRHVSLAAWI